MWHAGFAAPAGSDRKSTRLNSSHTEIYTLSLHDALPISSAAGTTRARVMLTTAATADSISRNVARRVRCTGGFRSEEHTAELQSHRDLHSFPTRRSSDLECGRNHARPCDVDDGGDR